jgi:hypothetical protein
VPFAPHVWFAVQQTAAEPTPHFLVGSVHVMPHWYAPPAPGSQIGVAFDPGFVESAQRTHLSPQLSTLAFNRQIGVPLESASHLW